MRRPGARQTVYARYGDLGVADVRFIRLAGSRPRPMSRFRYWSRPPAPTLYLDASPGYRTRPLVEAPQIREAGHHGHPTFPANTIGTRQGHKAPVRKTFGRRREI